MSEINNVTQNIIASNIPNTNPAQVNINTRVVQLSSATQTAAEQSNATKKVELPQANTQELAKKHQDKIKNVVSELNSYVQSKQRKLNFSVDDATGYTVIKVINKETDELVRQIPAEDILKVAAAMKEYGSILFDETA